MVGQALNAAVAVGSSQTVGHYRGVVALVETLIIAVLTILILQWLAITVDMPTLIFSGVVVLTILIPTVLLWCYAIGLLRRRAYNNSLDRSSGSVFLK